MEPRDFVRLSGLDLVNVLRNNYVNWYISRHFSRRYKNLPPLTLQPFWVEIPWQRWGRSPWGRNVKVYVKVCEFGIKSLFVRHLWISLGSVRTTFDGVANTWLYSGRSIIHQRISIELRRIRQKIQNKGTHPWTWRFSSRILTEVSIRIIKISQARAYSGAMFTLGYFEVSLRQFWGYFESKIFWNISYFVRSAGIV